MELQAVIMGPSGLTTPSHGPESLRVQRFDIPVPFASSYDPLPGGRG